MKEPTDDMIEIANHILWADLIVLATPIFSWYCTAKMKALLDRHYGFNKYYGSASGCLWEGKKVAIIATHGYDKEYATEPFETGIKRLCIHSKLNYVGMYSVQDEDDLGSADVIILVATGGSIIAYIILLIINIILIGIAIYVMNYKTILYGVTKGERRK